MIYGEPSPVPRHLLYSLRTTPTYGNDRLFPGHWIHPWIHSSVIPLTLLDLRRDLTNRVLVGVLKFYVSSNGDLFSRMRNYTPHHTELHLVISWRHKSRQYISHILSSEYRNIIVIKFLTCLTFRYWKELGNLLTPTSHLTVGLQSSLST